MDLHKNIVRNILYRVSVEDVYNYVKATNGSDITTSAINDDLFFIRKFGRPEQIEAPSKAWKYYYPQYPVLCGSYERNLHVYKTCILPDSILFMDLAAIWRFYEGEHEFMASVLFQLLNYEPVSMNLSEFERFLHDLACIYNTPKVDSGRYGVLNSCTLSAVEVLDQLIERHKWPYCFPPISTYDQKEHGHHWLTISEHLTHYGEASHEQITKFVKKHKNNIKWRTRELYKYIDSDFIDSNQLIWNDLDWNSIIVKIKLKETMLGRIMASVEARRKWQNTWVNAAYIAGHQTLSEAFIEHWFVNTRSDNPTNWANILRAQHISSVFRDRYEHKKSQTKN